MPKSENTVALQQEVGEESIPSSLELPAEAASHSDTSNGSNPDNTLRTLVKRLTDLLFLPGGMIAPQEQGLVDELLAKLLPKTEKMIRIRVAERLLQHQVLPAGVTHVLIHDDADIAAILLQSHLPFSDAELIAVVANCSEEHRKLIAQREFVPASASEAIIRFGELATIKALLCNRSAQISRGSFARLSERTRLETDIRQPLVERNDLPADFAHLIFWWMGPVERRSIINRFSCNRMNINEMIGEDLLQIVDHPVAEVSSVLRVLRPSIKPSKDEIDGLLQLLASGRREKFVEDLSTLARITSATAAQIMNDLGGEPIAVVAKSCSFGRERFFRLRQTLVELAGGEWSLSTCLDDNVTYVHDTLSTDKADMILRLWDQAARDVSK